MLHNDPIVFAYHLTPNTTHKIRIVRDNDNTTWFAVSDICMVLGLNRPSTVKALRDKDKEKRILSSKGKRPAQVVSLGGVYSIIRTSNSTKAKQFRNWVETKLLPYIDGNKPTDHALDTPHSLPSINEDQLLAILQDANRVYSHSSHVLAEHRVIEQELIHNQKAISSLIKSIKKHLHH